MDLRKELPRGSFLAFPGMSCRIAETAGRGSACFLYRAEKTGGGTVFLRELYPAAVPGLCREEDGTLTVMPREETAWKRAQENFWLGDSLRWQAYSGCPEPGGRMTTLPLNGTMYSLYDFPGGALLRDSPGAPSLRVLTLRTVSLLEALDAYHRAGYLHMDVCPENVLLLREGGDRVLLLDRSGIGSIAQWKTGEKIRRKPPAPYSAPETHCGDPRRLGTGTDLYAVAALFYEGMTGRPLTLAEQIGRQAPAAEESPLLRDAPREARLREKLFLRRGLHPLAARRYAEAGEMRGDLLRLLRALDPDGPEPGRQS